jgi:hypothetical protein
MLPNGLGYDFVLAWQFCARGPRRILSANPLARFDGEQNCLAKEIRLPIIIILLYAF